MTVRVEVVERHQCEHGKWGWHGSPITDSNDPYCPGGGSRILTGWPPEATEIVKSIRFKEFDGQNYVDSTLGHALSPNEIEELLTALWGHITGDNEGETV